MDLFLFQTLMLFYFDCALECVGSSFPNQALNPCPLQWKLRILTIGLPGKSQIAILIRRHTYTII